MTSVLLRILGSKTVQPGNEYSPNLTPGTSSADLAKAATSTADMAPEITIAEVQAREQPLAYPPAAAAAPTQMETTSAVRVDAHTGNGSGNRVIDALLSHRLEGRIRRGGPTRAGSSTTKATDER